MPPNRLNLRRSKNRQNPSKQPVATDAQIARIDALTATGRTNWLALLAYLAFVTVTTLGVQDVDFFVETRRTALPIVGVSIPTPSFFIFAPVLGAALYVYLHLHIRKVTEALGKPPLGPPPLVEGAPIETRLKPWLLNDFILRQRRDGAIADRPLDMLSSITSLALVWLSGPFVLGLMWWHSWPAHHLLMSSINAFCLMTSVYAGLLSWTKMRYDTGRNGTPRVTIVTTISLLLCLPVTWLTAANSKGIAQWVIAFDPDANDDNRTWVERHEAWVKTKSTALDQSAYEQFAIWSWETITGIAQLDAADLSGVRLAVLPPEHSDHETARQSYRAKWCQRNGLSPAVCGDAHSANIDAIEVLWQARDSWCAKAGFSDCQAHFNAIDDDFDDREWPAFRSAIITGGEKPDLSGKDLRATKLAGAELSGINLIQTQLNGADLLLAKLERANLSYAQMKEADLAGAQMQGALFVSAMMERTDLRRAQMQRANLQYAQMEEANLSMAQMEGVNLSGAQLKEADFSKALLKQANLSEAQMEEANLSMAQMEETDLSFAQMKGADLSFTQMKGAKLVMAQMVGASFFRARMEGVDLSQAQLKGTNLAGAQMQGANLFGAILTGESDQTTLLEYTNLRAATNKGGALRYVDFRKASFSPSFLQNSFGDATVILPKDMDRPCQWSSEHLSDVDFFGQWRGWIEAEYGEGNWLFFAPEGWEEVGAIPPPPKCNWHSDVGQAFGQP